MASLMRSLRCFVMRGDRARVAAPIHRLTVAGSHAAMRGDQARAAVPIHQLPVADNHAAMRGDRARVAVPIHRLPVGGNHATMRGDQARVAAPIHRLPVAGNLAAQIRPHLEEAQTRMAPGALAHRYGHLQSLLVSDHGEALYAAQQSPGGEGTPTQRTVRSLAIWRFRPPIPFPLFRGYATLPRNMPRPPDATAIELQEIRDFFKEKATNIKSGTDYIYPDKILSEVYASTPGFVNEAKPFPSTLLRPRNTVSCSLDGSDQDVFVDYVQSLTHTKIYHAFAGDELNLELLSGIKQMMYTTPPVGTFHYILKKQADSLDFIIDARLGWLYGVACPKGLFMFKHQHNPYITHTAARSLNFDGSYRYIAPFGIGNLQVGVPAFRRAFDVLVKLDGLEDSLEIREAFGTIVIHVCEAYKMHRIFELVCEAMGLGITVSIGDSWDPQVAGMPQKFGKYGELAARHLVQGAYMGRFDPVLPKRLQDNMAGIDSFRKVGENILFLPYNAVDEDFVERVRRTQFTMAPIDDGFGDPNVSLLNSLDPNQFSEAEWLKIQEENNFFFGDRAGGVPHPVVQHFISWPPSNAWIGRMPFNIGQKIPPDHLSMREEEPHRFWDRTFSHK